MKLLLKTLPLCFMLAIFLSGQQTFAQTSPPSILFSPEKISIEVGQEFTTELSLDTGGSQVGGVGAKVKFDPTLFEVTNVETVPLFPDYPANSFDNQKGSVTISGIVRSKDELYVGAAAFAVVHWKAKKAGLSTLQLLYEPNSTKDSNIAVLYGNGDILEKVNSVSVEITGDALAAGSQEGSLQSSTTTSDTNRTVQIDVWSSIQKHFPILVLLLFMLSLASHVFLFWKMNALEKKMDSLKP